VAEHGPGYEGSKRELFEVFLDLFPEFSYISAVKGYKTV
jgi:hypothetical protein